MVSLEETLNSNFMQYGQERTYIDKVLAKTESDEIKILMGKEDLSRKELSLLLYLLVSNEIKLLNFNEKDRYISGKFYVWIRQFAQLTMQIYDYTTKLEEMSQVERDELGYDKDVFEMAKNIRNTFVHMVKFLVDIYYFLNRSTLSYESTGFDTLTKSRTETVYPGDRVLDPVKKPGVIGIFNK